MPFVVAALVLVGALAALNLIFTFGVIRRLREHEAALGRRGPGHDDHPVMLAPGATVGDFAASTVDGEPVSRELLAGTTLVGFVSPSCPACHERLPQFVELARTHAGGRGQVLAVVVAPDGDEGAATIVAQLDAVARVVREPDRGPLVTAFGVEGYPAFALVGPHGDVVASGFEPAELNVPATA